MSEVTPKAPSRREEARDGATAPSAAQAGEEPDVLLDVPELRVDEVSVDVRDLRAKVSLQADVLQLVRLHVGVEAELGEVELTIKGVEAKVLLKAHLDNVARIIDRVLTTIDENPEIVDRLTEQMGESIEGVASDAGQSIEGVGAGAGKAAGEVGRSAATVAEEVIDDDEDDDAGPPRRERPRKPSSRPRGRGREEG